MAGRLDESLFEGEYRAVTPEIEHMVTLIRDTFLQQRQVYMPDAPLRASKAQRYHFVQTAFLVKKMGWDPVEFTTRQVRAMAETGNIFANGLTSLKVKNRQPKEWDIRSESLAWYTAQYNLLRDAQKVVTVQEALHSEVYQFSPLFRACTALRLGMPALAYRYRDAAMAELAVNPVIRELFAAEVARL